MTEKIPAAEMECWKFQYKPKGPCSVRHNKHDKNEKEMVTVKKDDMAGV
jgi:hypothetical protein